MSRAVKTIAVLVAQPGKTEELRGLLEGMVVPSRREPGNLQYNLWQAQQEDGRFVIEELYTDEAALAFHHTTPHFKNYLAKINDLAVRTVLMLDPVQVN